MFSAVRSWGAEETTADYTSTWPISELQLIPDLIEYFGNTSVNGRRQFPDTAALENSRTELSGTMANCISSQSSPSATTTSGGNDVNRVGGDTGLVLPEQICEDVRRLRRPGNTPFTCFNKAIVRSF